MTLPVCCAKLNSWRRHTNAMLCPLCRQRRARRFCPALGHQICSVCCGTKRLTEIRCPSDCIYLASSRTHPPAVVQRQQRRDLDVLLPMVRALSEARTRLFAAIAGIIARHEPQPLQRLTDADVADAAAALAATLETASRGVIYEHHATSAAAQHLATEVRQLITRLGSGSTFESDVAEVLRRIERGAREAGKALGGEDVAFRQLLARMAAHERTTDAPASDVASPESRLILP